MARSPSSCIFLTLIYNLLFFFFFKQKTAYEMRISDWSSDVCSSDLRKALVATNLFSSIGVQPVQTGRKAPDGTEYVDLRVLQEAGPTRTLVADAEIGRASCRERVCQYV